MQLLGRLDNFVETWPLHASMRLFEVREEMERELEHLLKQKDEQAGPGLTNPRTLLSPLTFRMSFSMPLPLLTDP